MVRNARYDLGIKYFQKELSKAEFFIIMVMVNTCCLIPYNSKWPLPSLPHFKCLTYVEFEYFGYHYGTQKISCSKLWHLSFQTPYCTCMPLWSLGEILHTFKDWRVLHNFQWKNDIVVNLMKYQKIMNI